MKGAASAVTAQNGRAVKFPIDQNRRSLRILTIIAACKRIQNCFRRVTIGVHCERGDLLRADRRLRPAAPYEHRRGYVTAECVATKLEARHMPRSLLRERWVVLWLPSSL